MHLKIEMAAVNTEMAAFNISLSLFVVANMTKKKLTHGQCDACCLVVVP